jgi:NADPH2:quinone reductase
MKAVVVNEFGGPEVLRVGELPDPQAGPGQVRVAVHAAGINPVDGGNRVSGRWAGLRVPCVLGYDVAGIVDQVGPGVDSVRAGDRVMAMTRFRDGAGGYAELAVLDAEQVAPVPASCSLVEAAAVPLAAGTAWEVLRRLGPAAGDGAWLLVHGASGGVGTFLVQLAAAAGTKVVAVGAARSHELLRQLGATACIDYHDGPVAPRTLEAAGGQVDAIADLVGGDALQATLGAVRPHGQLASIATPRLDPDPLLDENLTFHGVLIENDGERTRLLAERLGEGRLRPVVAEVFPPERAADAHRRLDTGHSGGKLVLEFRGEPGWPSS